MDGMPGILRQLAFQALPGRMAQMPHHLGRGHRRGEIQVHRTPSFLGTEHTIILSFSLQRKRPQPHISTLRAPSVFPNCLYANWSNALLRFLQNCTGIQGSDINLGMGDIYGRRAIRAVEFLITKLSGNCT